MKYKKHYITLLYQIKTNLTFARGILNFKSSADRRQDQDHPERQPVCNQVNEKTRDENDISPTSFRIVMLKDTGDATFAKRPGACHSSGAVSVLLKNI